MNTKNTKIGDNIKKFRYKLKISQKELAKMLGNMPISTLANYENNHRTPSIGTLKQIAAALGVTLDDLTGTGIQELIQSILNEKRAKNIGEISQKTNIELDKIKSFQKGSDYTPNDFDRIVHTFYGSYGDYIHQSPTQFVKRLANKRAALDKALDGLYKALEYHYGYNIEKNSQRELFIGLNIDNKKIFYTEDEFEKFLEYVCLSFPNFKYIVNKVKNKDTSPEQRK